MRSGIAQLDNTKDIEISVEEKSVRFKYDPAEHSLQDIARAIKGEGNRFGARLALQIEHDPVPSGTHVRLSEALRKVPGIQSVSNPDAKRVVIISFKLEDKTMLPEVLEAAVAAGVPLRDPPKKVNPELLAERANIW